MYSQLPEYLLRLLFALFLGGLIGIEREIKGKPAGMRTNMLMCMGSCMLMILSLEIFRADGRMGDPSRIAAQVVTGIGFLGAGTIIRSRFSVAGLTSAATLWFVTAVGLVIGWGDYYLGLAGTILTIATLTLITKLERHIAVKQRRHILLFEYLATAQKMKQAKQVLLSQQINPENIDHRREGDRIIVEVEYEAPESKHKAVLDDMRKIEGVDILVEY